MHPGWGVCVTVLPSKVGNMRGWTAIDVLIWIGTQGQYSTPRSAHIFTGDDNTLIHSQMYTHLKTNVRCFHAHRDTCNTQMLLSVSVHTCLKLCKMAEFTCACAFWKGLMCQQWLWLSTMEVSLQRCYKICTCCIYYIHLFIILSSKYYAISEIP